MFLVKDGQEWHQQRITKDKRFIELGESQERELTPIIQNLNWLSVRAIYFYFDNHEYLSGETADANFHPPTHGIPG